MLSESKDIYVYWEIQLDIFFIVTFPSFIRIYIHLTYSQIVLFQENIARVNEDLFIVCYVKLYIYWTVENRSSWMTNKRVKFFRLADTSSFSSAEQDIIEWKILKCWRILSLWIKGAFFGLRSCVSNLKIWMDFGFKINQFQRFSHKMEKKYVWNFVIKH